MRNRESAGGPKTDTYRTDSPRSSTDRALAEAKIARRALVSFVHRTSPIRSRLTGETESEPSHKPRALGVEHFLTGFLTDMPSTPPILSHSLTYEPQALYAGNLEKDRDISHEVWFLSTK